MIMKQGCANMASKIESLQSKISNREFSKDEINEMFKLTDQLEINVSELAKLYKGEK